MGPFGIKDKHALTDLAKFGTAARKKVHPDVLIGNYPPGKGMFREGDLLDANGVLNLIYDTIDPQSILELFCIEGRKLPEWLTKNRDDIAAETERATGAENDILRQLADYYDSNYTICLTEANRAMNIERGLQELINSNNASVNSRIDNVYTKAEVDQAVLEAINNIPEPEMINHEFLTQEQYDLLSSYDNNTIYFVLDQIDDNSNWHFGDNFPVTLTGEWSFGNTFPVVLG